jgi:hypothetical protein
MVVFYITDNVPPLGVCYEVRNRLFSVKDKRFYEEKEVQLMKKLL